MPTRLLGGTLLSHLLSPEEERRALAAWVPRRGCGGAPAPPKLADSTTFGAGQVLRLTLALPFP